MSQRDGFTGGFIAGTIVGGVVGGVIGALLASRALNESTTETELKRKANLADSHNSRSKRRPLKASSEQTIEVARRSLEDKIAQLNETIDEVRLNLGNVNGSPSPANLERTLGEE